MPLVTSTEMFKNAYGKYAVGAFNVNIMEIIQGIVDAAKEESARSSCRFRRGPQIRQTRLPHEAHRSRGRRQRAAICVHLDHGEDFEICKACVDGGFTSVMIDGSKYPFEQNIAITRQVVEYAHANGVVVEGELGRLAGVEDAVNVAAKDATYTDPDQAVEFVKRTGVDSLAIAIGTSHGAYKFTGEPRLDFARLEKSPVCLPGFPIVLHGPLPSCPSLLPNATSTAGN
jgi:fructose-bisphosphate aldolase class II